MPTPAAVGFRFAKGSIAKIEMWNFVTYEHSAIYPNSALNLLVGPNGSGKSSIVCAMCLGLGGNPRLLERGNNAKDYVRTAPGVNEAKIEISIATGDGDSVRTIRRTILTDPDREAEKTEWHIDDKSASKKQVDEIVAGFNIQLKNMTQFLPQDVVKKFPEMKPTEMLEKTQEALMDSRLSQLHKELIELNDAGRQDGDNYEKTQRELEGLKAKKELAKKEVDKYQEWQRVNDEVEKMKLYEPWLEYETASTSYTQICKVAKDSKKQYNQYLKKVDPLIKHRDDEKERHRKLQKDKGDAGTEKRRKETAHSRMQDNLEDFENERIDEEDALEGLVEKETKRQEKITRLESEIDEIQQKIDLEASSIANSGNVKEQKKQNYRDIDLNRKAFSTLRNRQNTLQGTVKTLRRDVDRINAEIEEANNAARRKLDALSNGRKGQQLKSAHMWVQKNQGLFEKPVYGPLGLYVDVADPEHARYLETCVGWNLRKAFVVQCQQDNDTLLHELKDNGRFKGAWVINYSAPAGRQSTHQPRVPKQQLADLGVTHYMVELIDAHTPAVVKAVLCDNAQLHNIAFGTVEAERRSEEVLARGVQTLVTKNKVNRGSKSVHSGRMVSQVSYVRGQADLFGMAVDKSKTEALKRQADDKDRQVGAAMDEYTKSKQTFATLKDQQKQLEEEGKQLAEMGQTLGKLRQSLRGRQSTLERVQQQPSIDQQRKVLEKKIERLQQKEMKELAKLVASMKGWMDVARRHDLLALEHAAMEPGLHELNAKVEGELRELDKAKDDFDTCKASKDDWKNKLRTSKKKAQDAGTPSPEIKDFWRTLPTNLEDLQEKTRLLESEADNLVGDKSVLQEYERMTQQIEQLEKEFEHLQGSRNSWLGKMREKHAAWLEGDNGLRKQVEFINEQFANGMSKTGFCGEVGLAEPPTDAETGICKSYAEFAIDIKVRFKDEQMLRSLDGVTQSGGEKSVSTMLYLISLQQLTEFPFRVVDEINQGMDPQNERKIFGEIVRAASLPNCPQYFVVTPKLLTGLEYNDCVKTHFVWNMPASCGMKQVEWEASEHCTVNPLKRRSLAGQGGRVVGGRQRVR